MRSNNTAERKSRGNTQKRERKREREREREREALQDIKERVIRADNIQ